MAQAPPPAKTPRPIQANGVAVGVLVLMLLKVGLALGPNRAGVALHCWVQNVRYRIFRPLLSRLRFIDSNNPKSK